MTYYPNRRALDSNPRDNVSKKTKLMDTLFEHVPHLDMFILHTINVLTSSKSVHVFGTCTVLVHMIDFSGILRG
jgi:hypothetical protein